MQKLVRLKAPGRVLQSMGGTARISAVLFFALLSCLRASAATVSRRPVKPKPHVVNSTGLVPPEDATWPRHVNRLFRYQASGIDLTPSGSHPLWSIPFAVDWRAAGVSPRVREQGRCAASWAFAAAGALDAAQAIGQRPPRAVDISVQQLLDCATAGNASCADGGWPADALEYVSRVAESADAGLRLFSERMYPYVGDAVHRSRCGELVDGQLAVRATSFETVSFAGALGLLLAVLHQPVVALIEADQPSFVAYIGRAVYDDAGCFSNGAVDHAVVIVGYNLHASTPYWLLQNSWGRQWGDSGYMRMAIRGGDGICGINSSPAFYPIVEGRGPCGPPNPCGGGGRCVAGCERCDLRNYCVCPPGTVSAANVDNSSSCIIANVCTTLQVNPCGVGTCLSNHRGGYACICPQGFANTPAADGSDTCFEVTGLVVEVYTTTELETCYLVAATFGLTLREFERANLGLNCSRKLPKGVDVNVRTSRSSGCFAFYPVGSWGETCGGIAWQLGVSVPALKAANPGLNCSRLIPGLQLCFSPDSTCQPDNCNNSGPPPPLCTELLDVRPADTCRRVIKRYGLTRAQFYALNPGVYCRHLAPRVRSSSWGRRRTLLLPGTQLCVNGTLPAFCSAVQCNAHLCPDHSTHVYLIRRGDTCASVVYHQFHNNFRLLRALNREFACETRRLYIGEPLCVPKR